MDTNYMVISNIFVVLQATFGIITDIIFTYPSTSATYLQGYTYSRLRVAIGLVIKYELEYVLHRVEYFGLTRRTTELG